MSAFLDAGSRTVASRPHRWHTVTVGEGTPTLMLHGAGSSGLSWRRLADLMAGDHRMTIPDLPGHGQTRLGTRQRSGLAHMAEDVATLAAAEMPRIDLIVAHSAGAAVALELARHVEVGRIVAINPALRPFDGIAGWLFPLLAKALGANPLVPHLFARMAGGERRVRELLEAQGSAIDAEMVAHYRALVSDPAHVGGALTMMGQWTVEDLRRALPEIETPVLFLAGANDRTVPPETSVEAAGLMLNARVELLDGLGHLAHEEAAERVAELVRDRGDRRN